MLKHLFLIVKLLITVTTKIRAEKVSLSQGIPTYISLGGGKNSSKEEERQSYA